MPERSASCAIRVASGAERVILIVNSSTTSQLSMELTSDSVMVNSVPSALHSQPVASIGMISRSGVMSTSLSQSDA